jgi:hypothetical protein
MFSTPCSITIGIPSASSTLAMILSNAIRAIIYSPYFRASILAALPSMLVSALVKFTYCPYPLIICHTGFGVSQEASGFISR